MGNLLPMGSENELFDVSILESETKDGYREGVYFDDEEGDFLRDGQYRLKSANGIENWEQWCVNCIMTERGKYPVYSHSFGIATQEAMKAQTREKAEAILIREICEALAADPSGRTEYVSDLRFQWEEPDSVLVGITVQGTEGVETDLVVTIDKRR